MFFSFEITELLNGRMVWTSGFHSFDTKAVLLKFTDKNSWEKMATLDCLLQCEGFHIQSLFQFILLNFLLWLHFYLRLTEYFQPGSDFLSYPFHPVRWINL